MKRYWSIPVTPAAIYIATMIILLLQGQVTAQENSLRVITSEADYEFGQVMRFGLEATGPEPIERVTLFISLPELSNTLTAEISLEPEREVSVEHHIDLTQLRLAPFTTVTYWWEVGDAGGRSAQSGRHLLEYVDDQFDWQRRADGNATVYWANHDPDIGQAALDVVAEVIPRMRAILPVDESDKLRIYVYPSASEIRAVLRLTGQDSDGAHARPDLGVILVAAGNPRTAFVELQQSLPHELSHLLLYRATGEGYEASPRWLDEGLATYFEMVPNANYDALLEEALAGENTFRLVDLCASFPSGGAEQSLAYAQSASVVGFIQTEYGNHALRQMVQALADGADCDSMTRRSVNSGQIELGDDWLHHLRPQPPATLFIRRWGIWIALIAAGFLLAGVIAFSPFRGSGAKTG